MKRRSIIPVTLLTITLVAACQDAPQYSSPDDLDGRSPETEVRDETPVTVAAPLTWCAPEPIPYDVRQIPALPEGVAVDGFCDVPSPDGRPEGAPTRQHTLHEGERLLEVQIEAGALPAARHTFRFAAQGWVQEITAEGANGFYSTGLGLSEYTLDAQGEMLHKLAIEVPYEGAPESEWLALEKEQTWQDGHLVGRTERDGEGGPVLRQWTWRWDGDRLVEASLLDTSRPEAARRITSTYTYDARGALTSISRAIEGVVVEREAWTFTASGALTARTFEARSPELLAGELGGDAAAWTLPQGLDTYQRAWPDYMSNPWPDALPVARGECHMLPHGPGHGYPDGEPEHQLGVAQDGRPSGIGFAYGGSTYGWNYGDLAWYGHDGIGSSWLGGVQSGPAADLETTVRYAPDGTMIGESAQATTFDGQRVEAERSRQLDARGRIVRDDLDVTLPDGALARSLRFERDERGGLIRRELLADGELVEQQTWTRDVAGHVLSHDVEPATASRAPLQPFEGGESLFAGFGGGPLGPATWTWRWDGDRVVERSGDDAGLHQTLEYDDDGRLTRTVGGFTSFEPGGEQVWTWDAEGRLIRQCQRWADEPIACTETVYDAAGRVAWRTLRQGDASPQLIDLHTWACRP